MKKIILASASAVRKPLLEQIGLRFEVEPSDYEEDMDVDLPPAELAKSLSREKALAVAKNHEGEDVIVIGADTFIVFEGAVLGKPKTVEKAKQMLLNLSGKSHLVITGFTITNAKTKKTVSKAVETKVYFRDLTEREIEAYVASGESLEKAGAYAIQELGVLLVDRIEGDYTNMVGLPVVEVARTLRGFGVEVLS